MDARPTGTPPRAEAAGGNLIGLVSWRRTALRAAAALAGGLMLAGAFPPLEWGWLAFLGLAPLLLVPAPATRWRRFGLGYLFGLAFWIPALWWLNTIGQFQKLQLGSWAMPVPVGTMLAGYCALWPALWYLGTVELSRPRGGEIPALAAARTARWRPALWPLGSAALWVSAEYLRSTFLTGFSWDQLGISQWAFKPLLQFAAIGGVYGVSLAVALTGTTLAWALALIPAWKGRAPARLVLQRLLPALPWLGVAALATAAAFLAPVPKPTETGGLSIVAIQGNIPQCRQYTDAEFLNARDTYLRLSRQALAEKPADLVVWPETAVPAPLRYTKEYWNPFQRLIVEHPTCRWLVGSIDFRLKQENQLCFNSAFLFGPRGSSLDFYDKIHTVPFGEYTPLAKYLPWLEDWIGMGRGLTPGESYTLFDLPAGVRAGINICYEDAYPEISRRFTLEGATALGTITNDAWYAESCGARQHLLHAVMRAVENGRPLLRSGNNSDTCLILPDGTMLGQVVDPKTGSPFHAGWGRYRLQPETRLTFYTCHGDWPVFLSLLATALLGLSLAHDRFREKQALLEAVRPKGQ